MIRYLKGPIFFMFLLSGLIKKNKMLTGKQNVGPLEEIWEIWSLATMSNFFAEFVDVWHLHNHQKSALLVNEIHVKLVLRWYKKE